MSVRTTHLPAFLPFERFFLFNRQYRYTPFMRQNIVSLHRSIARLKRVFRPYQPAATVKGRFYYFPEF
jgi:hypothetical protein